MEFSRQKYWSGLPCPPPGDLTDPGVEPSSPALQAGSLPTEQPTYTHYNLCWTTGSCVVSIHTLVLFSPESITMNKASGGDGIPVELFQILKDGAVKALHSICQQIWKTEQWPQDWKRSVFILIPKKGDAKECSNYCTIAVVSHTTSHAHFTR